MSSKLAGLVVVFLALIGVSTPVIGAERGGSVGRCRVCVLTDLGGDPDDEQSFVRFVVLSNMYDVEGIVLSPFQNKRRSDCTPYHARDHVNYVLDQYAKVVDRLNRHAAFAGQHAYPSAESLREVVRLGLHGFRFHDEAPETMERFIGEFGDHDRTSDELMRGMTPGSKLIVEILTKPKNAICRQYQVLFEMENISLDFTEEALRAVACKAKNRKTGARGLRAILEESMLDVMYQLPSMTDVRECVITDGVIDKGDQPVMTFGSKKKKKSGTGTGDA